MFRIRCSAYLAACLVLCTLVAASVTAAADPAAPDSTYFTLEAKGASLGWMSLHKTELASGNVRYSGNGILQGTMSLRWSLELTGDLTRLIRVESHKKSPDMEMTSKTVFKEGGGEPDVKIVYNGQEYSPDAEKAHASAVFIPQMVVTALAPLSERLAGEDAAKLDINLHGTNGRQAFGVRVVGQGNGRVTVRGEEVAVRSFVLTVTHADMPKPIDMTMYQRPDGSFFGVEAGGMKMFAKGGGASAETGPTSLADDITIDAGDVQLPAVVVLPTREEGDEDPASAVLMVAGPAQSDRDATSAGFPFFAHLADGLAEVGVVSLRYAPRDPTGAAAGHMSLLAADAVAALADLRARPDVDPAKILLLGHGEGAMLLGEVATLAAADGAPVAGLIYLAGVTVKGADLQDAAPRPAGVPWLDAYLAYDPRAFLQELRLPMLLLHGELDAEVPADQSTDLRAFMVGLGHMRASCTVAKNMNHYLQSAETGAVDEYAGLEPACAKGIVKRITSFAGFCTR